MSAIASVFSGSLNKLCFWHTFQNVRDHSKGLEKDVRAKMLRLFKAAAYAATEQVRVVFLRAYNVFAPSVKFRK